MQIEDEVKTVIPPPTKGGKKCSKRKIKQDKKGEEKISQSPAQKQTPPTNQPDALQLEKKEDETKTSIPKNNIGNVDGKNEEDNKKIELCVKKSDFDMQECTPRSLEDIMKSEERFKTQNKPEEQQKSVFNEEKTIIPKGKVPAVKKSNRKKTSANETSKFETVKNKTEMTTKVEIIPGNTVIKIEEETKTIIPLNNKKNSKRNSKRKKEKSVAINDPAAIKPMESPKVVDDETKTIIPKAKTKQSVRKKNEGMAANPEGGGLDKSDEKKRTNDVRVIKSNNKIKPSPVLKPKPFGEEKTGLDAEPKAADAAQNKLTPDDLVETASKLNKNKKTIRPKVQAKEKNVTANSKKPSVNVLKSEETKVALKPKAKKSNIKINKSIYDEQVKKEKKKIEKEVPADANKKVEDDAAKKKKEEAAVPSPSLDANKKALNKEAPKKDQPNPENALLMLNTNESKEVSKDASVMKAEIQPKVFEETKGVSRNMQSAMNSVLSNTEVIPETENPK